MTDFDRMRVLIKQEERYRWAVEKQIAKANRMTSNISPAGRTGGSRTGSRVEDSAIVLATLREEYKEIADELEAARSELKESITRIRNPKSRLEKTCLRMRYLQGMSIRNIALSMNYTEEYMHRKIRQAEALTLRIQKAQEEKKQDSSG